MKYGMFGNRPLSVAAGLTIFSAFAAGASAAGNFDITSPSLGPPGDDCDAAIELVGDSAAFDTTQATTDGPTEVLCLGSFSTEVNNDVWYRWTAPCSGPVTVNTCIATFDTKLAIYTACPHAPDTAIACNDDRCGLGQTRSQVTFTAEGGQSYLFRIGGFLTSNGTGTLIVTPPVCPPANDDCANAAPIPGYGFTTFTTQGATTDGPSEPACTFSNESQIRQDVWFRWTSCAAGQVTIDVCDATFDSKLAVYPDSCPTAGGTLIACNDDACGPFLSQSRLTFSAAANTNYLVRVGGFLSATGSGHVVISGPACPPPANDNCGNRAEVSLGATPFYTVGATTDGPAHAACHNSGSDQIASDIWFNYASQCTGMLTVDTCVATAYDSRLAVYAYDGTCSSINDQTLLECNDDACGLGGVASQVTVPVQAGRSYAIRVGGYNGATGSGILTLACSGPACPCDWNHSGLVNSQDFFDFLSSFFAGNADYNSDGSTNSQDFFDFLACFFEHPAGCA